jgi:hypothetical protein
MVPLGMALDEKHVAFEAHHQAHHIQNDAATLRPVTVEHNTKAKAGRKAKKKKTRRKVHISHEKKKTCV